MAHHSNVTRLLACVVAVSAACGENTNRSERPGTTAPAVTTPAGPSATELALQRAGAVIDAYRAAAGAPRLARLQSLEVKAEATMTGTSVPSQLRYLIQRPGRFRQDQTWLQRRGEPVTTSIVFNGRLGWFSGGRLGGQDSVDGRERAETWAARQAFVNFAAGVVPAWLIDLRIVSVTMPPPGDIDEKADGIVLTLTAPEGPAGRLFIDPISHLPRRLVAEYQPGIRENGGSYTVSYGDYRPEDGLLLPHRLELESASTPRTITKVLSYGLDLAMSPRVFSKAPQK